MARLFFALAAFHFLLSCGPAERPVNSFSDPDFLRIAAYQDQRLSDSLLSYLGSADAALRSRAVRAFGSIQDSAWVDRIGRLLLMDTDPGVRASAAFALGQTDHLSCERLLLAALVKEKNAPVIAEILEAYGKVTRRWNLDSGSFMNDSLQSAGLAWSLYRAGIRGKTDAGAVGIATALLNPRQATSARLGAAHYFAGGAKDFPEAEDALSRSALEDPSPSVRMAAALALGKAGTDSALSTLKKVFKDDDDSRVLVNAVRALRYFPFPRVKHYLYEALAHKDNNVGVAASESIIEAVTPDDWIEVSSLTGQINDWRIRANLYEAALKGGQHKGLAAEVERRYREAEALYEKAALLGSLRHYPAAYTFVARVVREADTAILRSAAIVSLLGMNQSANFSPAMTDVFADIYRDLLRSATDPAVLGTVAMALGDSTLGYRTYFEDASALHDARKKLTLPQHTEALQSIEAAIAHLEHRKRPEVINPYNHPIKWELVKQIPEDQTATIKTTRGHIVIRLHINEAPGSVANFVSLAMADYFDNRFVHRVVPNFVVQDGCKRGDGWGSENYSIRSEFSSAFYGTGSVGMASAGKDTEGTQWFITHSPTPHLEGRYTRFGEVIEGQTVVDYLQVGDKIIDVEVGNFTDR